MIRSGASTRVAVDPGEEFTFDAVEAEPLPSSEPQPGSEPAGPRPSAAAPRTTAPAGARSWLEITTLGLSIAVAIGFTRLFVGWSFVADVLVPAATMHFVAAALRRVVRSRFLPVLGGALASIVAWTAMSFPDTMWGPFPTSTTWSTYLAATREAFSGFRHLVAPVDATPGFVATAALVVLVCALYADTAVFVGNVPVQAMTCHVGVHIFGAVFARGDRQFLAGIVFAAAAGLHLLVVHTNTRGRKRWLGGDRRTGTRSLLVRGLVALAVALALIAVPARWTPLPEDAKIDLRKLANRDDDRQVVSPLVSVGTQLVNQRDSVMFTARHAGGPRYWRLTALDSFDGRTWSSKATYDTPMPTLADSGAQGGGIVQEVVIKNLGGIWLPLLYRPGVVESNLDVAFDKSTQSYILAEDATLKTNDSYIALSTGAEAIVATGGDNDRPVGADGESFTEIPKDLDPRLIDLARDFAGEQTDAVEAMRTMQNTFREFEYSTEVDYSSAENPTIAFLEEQRGFCQQFASTFALFARTLGLPARVAVGFTYGDYDAEKEEWTVRGRQAHAWPEVWITGLGWTAFEPTPGRGDPSTEGITGIPGAQDDGASEQASGPSGTTTTAAPATTVAPTPTTQPPSAATASDASPRGLPVGLFVLIAVLALASAVLVFLARRRSARRSFDGLGDRERVERAWDNTRSDLRAVGMDFEERETVEQFAQRAGTALDDRELTELGSLSQAAMFAATAPTSTEAARAVEIAHGVETRTLERSTWSKRTLRLFSAD